MPASNEEFIRKAFDAGLNEDEVRKAVAERNQMMAQRSQQNQSQKPRIENQKFLSGDALPNTGQLIAGTVGSIFGKPGRVAAGTVGRLGGEVIKQGTRDVIGGLRKDAGPEYTPGTPEFRAKSLEDLKALLGQGAVGVGSEAVGEYAVGPLVGKAVESVVSPLAGTAAKGISKAAGALRNAPGIKMVGDLLETSAKKTGRMITNKAEMAANTLLNPGKKLSELSPNIGKNFVKDVDREFGKKALKIGGETEQEIVGSIIKIRQNIGNKLNKQMSKFNKIIDFQDIKKQLLEKADSFKNIEANQSIAKSYKKEIEAYFGKTKKKLYDTWEDAIKWDDITRNSSGDLTKGAELGTGKKMAWADMAKEIRKTIKKNIDKKTKELFDDYNHFKDYEAALKGAKGEKLPDVSFSAILKILKQPGFLMKQVQGGNLEIPSTTKFPNLDLSGVASGVASGARDTGIAATSSPMIERMQAIQRQKEIETKR